MRTEAEGKLQGRILQGIGGFYTVRDENGNEYVLRAQRKLRRNRTVPKVGDFVSFLPGRDEEEGWIENLLPRTNELERPPVANIDVVVLVVSASVPQPDLVLLDKMLICARRHRIEPVIVVSKAETDAEAAKRICEQYAEAGVPAFGLSAVTGAGISELRGAAQGQGSCLCRPVRCRQIDADKCAIRYGSGDRCAFRED